MTPPQDIPLRGFTTKRGDNLIGVSIAARKEWEAAVSYFNKRNSCKTYPYGSYFFEIINGKEVVFYETGVRKVNGTGANQYMICRFDLEKVIVAGTCAGIDDQFSVLDIVVPNLAVQYDCTVKEIEPLIKKSFNVEIDTRKYGTDFTTGIIGTADKAVVMWKDYLELRENAITIADTEAAAVACICRKNHVECVIIKGISDFPVDDQKSDEKSANEEQISAYLSNTPEVMQRIFDRYLGRFI